MRIEPTKRTEVWLPEVSQGIDIKADSVCVHGDGEKALLFVEKIRKALTDEGIEICPLEEVCR